MSKRNRDSSDSMVKNNLSIKISDSLVLSNKRQNFTLPDNLVQEPPPAQTPDLWFSFSKKYWHPIVLVDSNGKNVSSKIPVQLEISHVPKEKDTFKAPVHCSTALAAKGIFWFGTIKAHCNGGILLKFTSSGADTLIHRIDIDEDLPSAQVKPATKGGGNSKRENEKLSGTEIIENTKTKGATSSKDAILDPKNKQARMRSNSIEAVKNETNLKSKAVVKSADVPNPKGGIGGASSSVLGGTGGVPKLNTRSRLERSVKPNNNSLTKHSTSNITRVKGPMLEIVLPVSLTVALLDDRARIDSDIIGSKKHDNISGSKSQAMVPITVSELLTKVQQRAKHQIGECETLILRLRQLFECLFESSILYSSERIAMKQQLATLKAQNITYADSFCGIYLLRLIVLVVTGADSIYPLSTDLEASSEEIFSEIVPEDLPIIEGESTSNIENLMNSSAIDINNAVEKPSTSSNISQSSQQRRIAVQNKHINNEFYKFQEVLNCALKELEESTHIIF